MKGPTVHTPYGPEVMWATSDASEAERLREAERELADLAATFYGPTIPGMARTAEAVAAVRDRADELLAEAIEREERFGFTYTGHRLAEVVVDETFYALDLARRSAFESTDEGDSWEFLDAVEMGSGPIEAPFLGSIIYPASRHLISGESGCGKSWLALWLVAQELRERRRVVWIDADDMGPARLLDRLRSFGVDDEVISSGFLLVRPERAATDEAIARVTKACEDGVRLVVVDSFNPALSLEGLDPIKVTDLDAYFLRFAKPVNEAGAAIVLLDHVPKHAAGRSEGYAYGGERKRSGVTVQLTMKPTKAFARDDVGRARLVVEKDRDGLIGPRGHVVGLFEMRSDGGSVTAAIVPDPTTSSGGTFRPTALMEKVSRLLESETEPQSRNTIEKALGGKALYVRRAIDFLADERYISEHDGPNRSRLYLSLTPYREDDDFEGVRPEFVPVGDEPNEVEPLDEFVPSSPTTGTRTTEDDPTEAVVRPVVVPKDDSLCVVCGVREHALDSLRCGECTR